MNQIYKAINVLSDPKVVLLPQLSSPDLYYLYQNKIKIKKMENHSLLHVR